MLTSRRYVSAKIATVGGGDDNPAVTKIATDSRDYCDDKAAPHRDVAGSDNARAAVFPGSSPSDVGQIKKSMSFRAESRRPSGHEADKNATSPRERTGRPTQRLNLPSEFRLAPAPPYKMSRNAGVSGRDLSLDDVLRDQIEKRDETSIRSQSQGPAGRSVCTGGLKTRGNTGVAGQLNCNGGWSSTRQQLLSGNSRRRRSTSLNWYVDLGDVSGTEFQPSRVDGCVDGLRQYRGDCPTGSRPSPDKLEQDPCRTVTWKNASGVRGRATASATSEPSDTRHHDGTMTTNKVELTSALDDLEQKFTQLGLHRTLSLRHLSASSPRTDRTSAIRTGTDPCSEDPVFHRSSDSKCRRSMIVTRPRNCEMSVRAGGAVQTAEREQPPRTRSVSLSEQYWTMIGGDWFDNFPTSSADVNRQEPTKIRDPRRPHKLSRELKPDFVIYV